MTPQLAATIPVVGAADAVGGRLLDVASSRWDLDAVRHSVEIPQIDVPHVDLSDVCIGTWTCHGEPQPELLREFAEERGLSFEQIGLAEALSLAAEHALGDVTIAFDDVSAIPDDLFGFDPCVYGICLPEHLIEEMLEFGERRDPTLVTVDVEAVIELADQLMEADALVFFDTTGADVEPGMLPDLIGVDLFA